MQLSAAEAARMRAAGTELAEVTPPQPARTRRVRLLPLIVLHDGPKDGMYDLKTDCGNLQTDPTTGQRLCGIHEDPERPDVCSQFMPGSYGCMVMRVEAGVDTPSEHDHFLALDAAHEWRPAAS